MTATQADDTATAELNQDLDGLIDRVMRLDTRTPVGFNRRLAEIAEAHYILFAEAQILIKLRFKLQLQQGVLTKDTIEVIPGDLIPYLVPDKGN